MKHSLCYTILLLGSFTWCVLLFIPPLAAGGVLPCESIAPECYRFFHKICHQYDSRTFFLFEHKLAVCIRCTSIYVGFFVGIACVPLFRKRSLQFFPWFVIASLPMLIDVLLDIVGIHSSTSLTRLSTGMLFGIIAAIVLTPSLIEAFSQILSPSRIIVGASYESKT